jgi:hypothetical protein
MGPMLFYMLILKADDFSCKALDVGTSGREHCGILCLHSRHPL